MSHVCHTLHQFLSGMLKRDFQFDPKCIPKNGIYILFEKGETGHDTERIVRIGTHAGRNQLHGKLQQHFADEHTEKNLFRKNIGRAILNRRGDSFLKQWESLRTTSTARGREVGVLDPEKLLKTEIQVTYYIHEAFRFVSFAVEEKAERLLWESKIISTVAQCSECRPSNNWLGLHSPQEKIRESGLWLVNELYQEPLSEEDFGELEKIITKSHETESSCDRTGG